MSWQATSWVIEHSQHKGSNLLVMLMIANCANESGTDCWPSKERLAKDTRMSLRQVDRTINKLEASGELAVKRSSGRLPNRYGFPLMNPNPDKMTGLKRNANPVISGANPVIAMSHDPSVRTVNKNGQLKPRKRGSVDDGSKFGIEMIQMLPDDWLEAQHALLKEKYPELNFDHYHEQWCLARFRDGGIGRGRRHTITLNQFAADLQIFFANCEQNRLKRANGNGYRPSSKASRTQDAFARLRMEKQ